MTSCEGYWRRFEASGAAQDELNMSKEAFRDRFGDEPRKDDLTVLAPKQDDPTEQVPASSKHASVCCKHLDV